MKHMNWCHHGTSESVIFLFFLLRMNVNATDSDDDIGFRRSKRSRADFRPPGGATSDDDGDGPMLSSPGRSQQGHSRDDVPMTDQTDDDPYEVLLSLPLSLYIYHGFYLFHLESIISFVFFNNVYRMILMLRARTICIVSKEH